MKRLRIRSRHHSGPAAFGDVVLLGPAKAPARHRLPRSLRVVGVLACLLALAGVPRPASANYDSGWQPIGNNHRMTAEVWVTSTNRDDAHAYVTGVRAEVRAIGGY